MTRKQGPKKRIRRPILLTLSAETIAALTQLAGPGGSRSAIVDALVLEHVRSKQAAG